VSIEYITEANIDDAIQQALSTEVDHNYAIDRDGTYFHGYETKPVKPAPEPSES
jgi:Mitochondrial ribosome subunit S26